MLVVLGIVLFHVHVGGTSVVQLAVLSDTKTIYRFFLVKLIYYCCTVAASIRSGCPFLKAV